MYYQASLVSILVPILSVGVVLILLALAIVAGQKLSRQLREVKEAVVRKFSLNDNSPKGIFPNLSGEVRGMPVTINVLQLQYSSSHESSHKRPHTRVRVQLRGNSGLTVYPRSKRYDKTPEQAAVKTGDPIFDERYVVYLDPTVRVDVERALPPQARQAFLRASPPVMLSGDSVWWIQIKHVRDSALMLKVVESCLQVGEALQPPERMDTDRS